MRIRLFPAAAALFAAAALVSCSSGSSSPQSAPNSVAAPPASAAPTTPAASPTPMVSPSPGNTDPAYLCNDARVAAITSMVKSRVQGTVSPEDPPTTETGQWEAPVFEKAYCQFSLDVDVDGNGFHDPWNASGVVSGPDYWLQFEMYTALPGITQENLPLTCGSECGPYDSPGYSSVHGDGEGLISANMCWNDSSPVLAVRVSDSTAKTSDQALKEDCTLTLNAIS